jgi:hypothetical protein
MRARAMRIEANLPDDLWPESCKTAPYLLNRTPTKQLGWKTPLEALQQALGRPIQPPNITHLRVFGCRTYPMNQHIPRSKKLEPRAYIGYLVGYESSNIYRIWIPSKKKVITTRDVTFNESLFYNPDEPRLDSQLKEAAPDTIVVARQDHFDEIDSEYSIDDGVLPENDRPASTQNESTTNMDKTLPTLLTPEPTPDREEGQPQQSQSQQQPDLPAPRDSR